MADEPEVVTPVEALQRAQRRAAQEEIAAGPQERRDELKPGGGFLVNGVLVDGEGNPIEKGGKK